MHFELFVLSWLLLVSHQGPLTEYITCVGVYSLGRLARCRLWNILDSRFLRTLRLLLHHFHLDQFLVVTIQLGDVLLESAQ